MVRFIILGVVLGVAFTLFTIVDAAMSDPRRSRGVGKHIWVLLCVVLPVIGGLLWLTIGKGPEPSARGSRAPDDDPLFGDMSKKAMDQRIADLEQQLHALDDEVYPGEVKDAEPDDSNKNENGNA